VVKARGAQSLAAQLRGRRDDALFYRRLATLRTDVPLSQQQPEELRWHGVDEAALAELAEELEDPRIVERAPQGPIE
jgi:hypothetical protein